MIPLINKPNVHGSDSEYPYGDIRDRDGAIIGTPVDREVYADMHQFFEKMMDESGIVANNNPDNEYHGWQLWEALVKAIQTQQEFSRFHVKLTQTSTNAPTLDFQAENDFSSSPTWSYDAVGRYEATFGSAVFPNTAKCMKITESLRSGATIYLSFPSSSVLRVETFNAAGVAANDLLAKSDIYVNVYP